MSNSLLSWSDLLMKRGIKIFLILITVPILLFIAGQVFHLVQASKLYLEGPSIEKMEEWGVFRYDIHNTKYKLQYIDKDTEGCPRYHFISTKGENIPCVVTCGFRWWNKVSFSTFPPSPYPAGWYYYCSNKDEWYDAVQAWEKKREEEVKRQIEEQHRKENMG